jgi:general nucleoside transport system ATP-binding protein
MIDHPEPVLALRRISKRFGPTIALDDVSFELRRGTVHALLGENGAGKTTLLHIAFGMVRPDSGSVLVQGRDVRLRSPADAIASGIGMVHQHFTLVPAMTVAENLALGGHGRLRRADAIARVHEVAALTGFALDPEAPVETLPIGAQQRVEIAKALVRRATVLVLDEPTAVLAPAEASDLLRWLRAYANEGNSAVLITHKLREALAVADDVTVLRRGHVAHTGPAGALSPESLTTAMIGGEELVRGDRARPALATSNASPIVFHAEQLTLRDDTGAVRLRDAAFSVRGGEIVGIVGVEGAGQRELLRALAGRLNATGGSLTRPAMVGFVPEDRHGDAVLLNRSLAENVALREAGARRGLMHWSTIRAHTNTLMRAFDVRGAHAEAEMRTLSGGNQQKLVLARELDDVLEGERTTREGPLALVVENPTRGLDVRATADVHTRLRVARDRGAAVVMYSSDLDEVLSLASRMLVAYAGTLREVPPDRDVVGRAMLGSDRAAATREDGE